MGPFSAAADVGLPFAVLSPINDGFRKSWRRNISRIMLLHLKLEAGREGAYMEVTGHGSESLTKALSETKSVLF